MVVICGLFCTDAWAGGVSFIQITDPHIFDGRGEAFENAAAFDACVDSINQRIEKHGTNYQFVVVTGDLGLEGLLDGSGKAEGKLQKAAEELAARLSRSRIKTWLFVPGNNDLYDELPYTIGFYHDFLKALKLALETLAKGKGPSNPADAKITAVDLCPRDGDLTSGTVILGDHTFIGFNNASFKNSNSMRRAQETAAVQEHYVQQVLDRLQNLRTKFAYVFYHIPEIDDPHWASMKADDDLLKQRQALFAQSSYSDLRNPYVFSSWVVHHRVRDLWGKVVRDDRVKGLFAGHFHSSSISAYKDNFDWLRTTNYPYDSRSKLKVSPPVSVKFQHGSETARGFQEVSLDEYGGVARHLLWYQVVRMVDDAPAVPETAPTTETPTETFLNSITRAQVKETIEVLASLLTLVAVVFGGSWSYLLFVRTRQKYPSANISQDITYRPIPPDKVWLRVTVTLQNTGKVLLSLVSGICWIQQVKPLEDNDILGKIESEGDPVSEGASEIGWPLVAERNLVWAKGEREIEPSETDQVYFDFIIDSEIKTIVAYCYFTNVQKFKRKKSIGWQIAKVHDLSGDLKIDPEGEKTDAPGKNDGEAG